MAKVSLYLKKSANQLGEFPIYYRIAEGKKKELRNSGYSVKLKQWDQEKQEVINHTNKTKMNQELARNLVLLSDKVITEKKTSFTAIEASEKDQGRVLYADLLKWFYAYKETIVKASVIKRYNAEVTKMADFKQIKYFDEITGEFLQAYQKYMTEVLNNEQNTIWGTTKFLKSLVNFAINKKELTIKDPFKQYARPKYNNKVRDRLTAEETMRIKKSLERGLYKGALYDAAAWFLFACYTGLRFQDIMDIDPASQTIGQDFVTWQTGKTGSIVSIPLTKELKKSGLLEIIKTLKKRANQDINRALKSVAAVAEVDKDISFHVARHTFATQLSRSGIPIEVAKELLGHSNIKTTQIYYKVENERIKEAVKDFGFEGK